MKTLLILSLFFFFSCTENSELAERSGSATETEATIRGTILNPDGSPQANAQIFLRKLTDTYKDSTKTNTLGAFELKKPAQGLYHITSQKDSLALSQSIEIGQNQSTIDLPPQKSVHLRKVWIDAGSLQAPLRATVLGFGEPQIINEALFAIQIPEGSISWLDLKDENTHLQLPVSGDTLFAANYTESTLKLDDFSESHKGQNLLSGLTYSGYWYSTYEDSTFFTPDLASNLSAGYQAEGLQFEVQVRPNWGLIGTQLGTESKGLNLCGVDSLQLEYQATEPFTLALQYNGEQYLRPDSTTWTLKLPARTSTQPLQIALAKSLILPPTKQEWTEQCHEIHFLNLLFESDNQVTLRSIDFIGTRLEELLLNF